MTTATKRNGARAAALASETWTLLQEIAFSQRPRWMAIIRQYDLIPPHWIALQTLEEPRPMGELAKQLSCDNSNVTWITDRLEERGLVTRTQAPHDRRVRLLVLTPKGRRLLPLEPLWASFNPTLLLLNNYAVKFRSPGHVATRADARAAVKA